MIAVNPATEFPLHQKLPVISICDGFIKVANVVRWMVLVVVVIMSKVSCQAYRATK